MQRYECRISLNQTHLISEENICQTVFLHTKKNSQVLKEINFKLLTNSKNYQRFKNNLFFYHCDLQRSMISCTHGRQSTSRLTLWSLWMGDHQGRSGAPPRRPEQARTTELHSSGQMQVRTQVNLEPVNVFRNMWISEIDFNYSSTQNSSVSVNVWSTS